MNEVWLCATFAVLNYGLHNRHCIFGIKFVSTYCSVVWNNCGATLTGHVERIQNYALRVILRKPPLTSSELLQRTLGWTTLKARRHNAMLCQVHRCCTNQAPPYLCAKFSPNSNLNYIRTRGSNKLYSCQDHRPIFTTQVLSSKEPCILITYLSISESLRAVNNLRLPYFSISNNNNS